MVKKVPNLSDGEWVVMKACWNHKKFTAREIYDEVSQKKAWDYRTVKTMLDRLVVKEYLACERQGNVCFFQTKVSRQSTVSRALEKFVSEVLDHNFSPLIAHFSKETASKEEIESLKKLIAEKENSNE